MFKTLCTSVMHGRALRCAALLALAPLVAVADAGMDPDAASSALYEDVLAVLAQPAVVMAVERDDADYRLGSEDDPALAQARLLRQAGAVDRAELALLATARDGGGVAAMPMPWWIERLRCALAHVDLARAERLADEAARLAANDAGLAAARLELVERALGDGDLSRAERVLAQARPALAASRRQDGRDLQGRLLLATARNAEAVAALAAGSQTDEALAYGERAGASVSATAYRRFNLAIAMLRQGDEARGLSWLDLLGRSQSPLPELVVLRDRANLLMGLHFLKAGRGRIALGMLGRIPVEGPYSDRALLGMGWAMLAPPDSGSSRPLLDDGSQHSGRGPALPAPLKASLLRLRVLTPELNGAPAPARFETDRSPRRIEDALRAAIAVWQPLAAGDPDNEVAIEGRLAIAYARDQLGDSAAAVAAYEAVIASLKTQEAALEEARVAVGDGGLQGWIATAAAAGPGSAEAVEPRDSALHRLQLPLDDGIGGVHRLVDEAARWQRLQGELDARRLPQPAIELAHVDDGSLDAGPLLDQGDEGAALRERVDARLAGLKADAEQRALSLLDTRRAQIQRMQERALFALARLQDDPGIGRGPSAACLRGACP